MLGIHSKHAVKTASILNETIDIILQDNQNIINRIVACKIYIATGTYRLLNRIVHAH